jgi:hypothetical protein
MCNPIKLLALIQRYHKNPVVLAEEQLAIIHDYVFNKKFYPIKEKLAARYSVVRTVQHMRELLDTFNWTSTEDFDIYYARMVGRFISKNNVKPLQCDHLNELPTKENTVICLDCCRERKP